MALSHDSGRYKFPEIVFARLLRRAMRDDIPHDGQQFLRAVVLAVDPDGGALENESGDGSFSGRTSDGRAGSFQATVGPKNPPGSVKARILTAGHDRLYSDQESRVFWPLFPQEQLAVPVTPGEHVYVLFEDSGMNHGLWIARVSGHDSAGAFMGADSYTAPSAQRSAMDAFEDNPADYPRDDASAALAPSIDAMGHFEGED